MNSFMPSCTVPGDRIFDTLKVSGLGMFECTKNSGFSSNVVPSHVAPFLLR